MRLIRAVIFLFVFVLSANAQTSVPEPVAPTRDSGDLNGTVTDASGAVVVGAKVTVRNAAGVTFSTVTDGSGKFHFSELRGGSQVITVNQPGFAASTSEAVPLSKEKSADISIVLAPLGDQTSVTVIADRAVEVETSTSAVSNTLDENEVLSFPTNGRNFLSFISLSAGVSNQTGQDEIKVGVVGSAKFAVNGGRTEYNSFLVDGSDVLNTDVAASHGQSTLMVYPSIDAVKELKVMTSNYGAEYGRSASGTVVVALKAGEARLHGSMYEFIRNEFFNARNYFDHDPKAPLYRRNDFGGSFGGPLFIPHVFNTKKDKTFIFFSEEFRKERSPQQFSQGVPSDAERGYNLFTGSYGAVGDFSAVCPSNIEISVNPAKYPDCPTQGGENAFSAHLANQVPISPTALAFLQSGLIPRANATAGCISSTGSCYDATVSPATDYRQDLGRLDQALPLRSHLTFSVVHDHWRTVVAIPQWSNYINSFPSIQNEFQGPGLSAIAHLTTQVSKLGVNDLSYGYTLQRIKLADVAGLGVNLSRAAINSVPLGTIFTNNYGKLPSLVFGGNNHEYGGVGFNIDTSFTPWSFSLGTQSIRDAVTEFWHNHTVLMGFQLVHARRTEVDAANGGNTGDVQGTIFFSNVANAGSSRNSFADFLIGNSASSPGYIQAYAQDNAQLPYTVNYWTIEPYAQDDWKVTPRLTLNLGYRLSMFKNWEPEKRSLYNWDQNSFDQSLMTADETSVNVLQGYLQSTSTMNAIPFSNAYSLLYNGLVRCGTRSVPTSCQSTKLLNSAPRVGFALDPTGRGLYAIRGGYGIFFEHGTGSEANAGSLLGNPPYVLSVQQSNPISYGLIGLPSSQSTVTPAFPLNMTSIPAKTVWPYEQQWNFSVEAQLPSDAFASVSYVGSKGTHLAVESQINQLPPVSTANNPFPVGTPILNSMCFSQTGPPVDANPPNTFYDYQTGVSVSYADNPVAYRALYAACNNTPAEYDASGNRLKPASFFDPNSLRPLQGIGRVQSIKNVAGSVYHSMQLSVRRNRGPLDLVLSYTYSHSIDSASDRYESTFVDAFDLAANRASSSFDQRQLANASFVYQLPLLGLVHQFHDAVNCSDRLVADGDSNCPVGGRRSYGGPSRLARLAFSNWSLSAIILSQTGSPFSVVNNQSPNGVSVLDNAGLLIGGTADSYADRSTKGVPCVRVPAQLPVTGTFGPLLGNPCRFQAPRGLTQGNTGRNYLNNPSRTNFDFAFLRNIKAIHEANLQFRAEVFNAFNHTQFVIYDPNKGNTAANTISCYGDASTGFSAGAPNCEASNGFLRPIEAHRPRTMQFGLKMDF